MLKSKKLTLAVLIPMACMSVSYASEQSEAKGFVEDSTATLTIRNGWIYRDKKDPGVHDQSSWAQGFIANYESGFTPGVVGFGIDAIGDFAFKLGDNNHSGQEMIPLHHSNNSEPGTPYNQWSRGGASVKARISNTTIRYGTQISNLPVLQSNTTGRLLPEYYTGTSITSREIKDLEVSLAYYTKDQGSAQIATDQNHLKRAIAYGAKYKVNDQFKVAYYGADLKDALNRHYVNLNYTQPLDAESSLTFDAMAYHTKYEKDVYDKIAYTATGTANTDKKNTIFGLSSSYNTGPHNVMLAYQQNTGDSGYAYNFVGDGAGTVYLPNSYMSDFVGNKEKSVQVQYNLDLGKLGVLPGLNWTTAYVYGWDINVQDNSKNGTGKLITDNAKEREFFNQVSYTVQSGAAKDLSVKVRNSIYRASQDYNANQYIGSTNEWRIFIDYPWKFF